MKLHSSVVALEEGTGKNEGLLGAIVVEGEDDGKFFRLNVGSGLTDENREQIWANQDAVIGQLVEIRNISQHNHRIVMMCGVLGFHVLKHLEVLN